MTAAKLDGYGETLNALARETVACLPPSWSRGTLTIDCDGRAIEYRLENAEEEGKASISEALRARCEELYVVMSQHGDAWRRAALALAHADGAWTYETTFDYASDATGGEEAATTMHREHGKARW